MRYDVIIIGSGLGGLACAHVLSKAGMSVLVLEKGRQAGGCLQSYRRGQYSFDTGFHYVGGLDEGQSLHAAFRMLGLLDLPWRRLDNAFDRIMIGERRFSFVQGYEAFAEHLRGSFPSENEALRSYTTLLRQAGERQLRALDSGNGAGDFPDAMFGMAAWRYLTDHFRDPLLIDVLSATSLKMELRKASLPLFTFVHGNGSFIESSWRLAGDGSLIVDSLVHDIQSWGGQVVCGSEVVELLGKDGRLVAARCSNGELYEAKLFISDAHPAVTCGWIGPDVGLRGIYRRRLDGLENTFGMLTVSLVIKPRMLRYFNWNQYIYRQGDVWDCCREDRLVGGLLVSARVPEEDDGYLRQVDLLTPMTWNRFAGWEGTRIGCRGEDYVALKERLADECVALAERFIPGLQRMIESRYISTPLTYGDYTATPQGSAYGPRKDYNNPLMTVLSSRTPIRNLLLTGQGLMLHGLHGVTMTALLTCAEALELVRAAGQDGEILPFDVADGRQVQEALDGWHERHPSDEIEVLVNNAGIRRDNVLALMPEEDWDLVVGITLRGFYNLTRQLLPRMSRRRYGRIINMASVSGLCGIQGQTNYSAAKGGLIAATKALALEVARRNITVNAVAPGFIKTDMVEGLDEEASRRMIPLGRFGTPEEVAELVGFLASPAAGYITGEVISINGGLHT